MLIFPHVMLFTANELSNSLSSFFLDGPGWDIWQPWEGYCGACGHSGQIARRRLCQNPILSNETCSGSNVEFKYQQNCTGVNCSKLPP